MLVALMKWACMVICCFGRDLHGEAVVLRGAGGERVDVEVRRLRTEQVARPEARVAVAVGPAVAGRLERAWSGSAEEPSASRPTPWLWMKSSMWCEPGRIREWYELK